MANCMGWSEWPLRFFWNEQEAQKKIKVGVGWRGAPTTKKVNERNV